MSPEEVAAHAGRPATVTGQGDLWFDERLRPIISIMGIRPIVTVLRLTKAGLALVEHEGKRYSVPPRNVMAVSP